MGLRTFARFSQIVIQPGFQGQQLSCSIVVLGFPLLECAAIKTVQNKFKITHKIFKAPESLVSKYDMKYSWPNKQSLGGKNILKYYLVGGLLNLLIVARHTQTVCWIQWHQDKNNTAEMIAFCDHWGSYMNTKCSARENWGLKVKGCFTLSSW